jgi:hypothetical protein
MGRILMLRLTDSQREAVVDYFYDSEIAYLVELLMMYLPEDFIRSMGEHLTEDLGEEV